MEGTVQGTFPFFLPRGGLDRSFTICKSLKVSRGSMVHFSVLGIETKFQLIVGKYFWTNGDLRLREISDSFSF